MPWRRVIPQCEMCCWFTTEMGTVCIICEQPASVPLARRVFGSRTAEVIEITFSRARIVIGRTGAMVYDDVW